MAILREEKPVIIIAKHRNEDRDNCVLIGNEISVRRTTLTNGTVVAFNSNEGCITKKYATEERADEVIEEFKEWLIEKYVEEQKNDEDRFVSNAKKVAMFIIPKE